MLLFAFLLLALQLSVSAAADSPPRTVRHPVFLPSPPPRSRQVAPACQLSTTGPAVRKLVQINGSVEHFQTFSLCPVGTSVGNLELVDFSSDQDVLRISTDAPSDVQLDRVSIGDGPSSCQNVSASFTFDRMVGIVSYRLVAKAPAADKILCSTDVAFVIVGLTVYMEKPIDGSSVSSLQGNAQTEKVILSGDGNEVISNYRDNLVQRLIQFKIKIQFPDGTDSASRSLAYVASMLEAMMTNAETDATSPVRFGNSTKNIVNPNEQIHNSSCGVAIETVSEPGGGTIILFSLRYESYKDGPVTLLFEWDLLTRDDAQLADEQFVNILHISVGGDPPPILELIQPVREYRRAGGENLTFVMDNVEGSDLRVLRVGNVRFLEIQGSFRRRSDGLYEAIYITEPGSGAQLEWSLYVSFPERTRKAKIVSVEIPEHLAYNLTPLTIATVEPAFGVPGTNISLSGYFDGFDPTSEDHEIIFGQKTLRMLGILPTVNEEGTQITFICPTREAVGAAYDYEIEVILNDETSASATFTFTIENLTLSIAVYGASYNQKLKQHELGGCAISRFIATLPSGVTEPKSFAWAVVDLADPKNVNLILEGEETETGSKTLFLLPKVFRGKPGKYRVSVSCVVNGEALTADIVVQKLVEPIIGLTLSQIRPRSIAIPDVPVRVSAFVMPPRPECFNQSSKILYKWSYRDVVQQFSYQNFSSSAVNGSSAPARLGREYVIPQNSLAIGTFKVALTAFMEEVPTVFGSASTFLTIRPSTLVPIIGYGASKITHSSSDELLMTAEQSYNPDEKYSGSKSRVDQFVWSCKVSSFGFETSKARDCDNELLPSKGAKSFTVPMTYLQKMRKSISIGDESIAFSIQYSLRVGFQNHLSPEKYQIVEIIADTFQVAKLDDLRVLNNRGESVDWSRVEHFSDIIIEPDGKNVSWSFRVTFPPSSVLMLQKAANLIIHPGYLDPTSPALTQTLPLGVRGGTLRPAQTYEISISISSLQPGMERGEARFLLQTPDKPRLVMPDLPVVFGDSETMYTAYAQVNLDSSHAFLYFFFLVSYEGEEYCLDGCGGHSFVQFKLTEAGTYRIVARLMDMQGKSLLDEVFFAQNVTMTSENFEVSALSTGASIGQFDKKLRDLRFQGDHGTFELLASSLVSRVRKDNTYASSEEDMKVLDLAVDAMHQIVQNSAPTTMTAKSYVKTAGRIAAMDAELFASPKTMYTILSMVDRAVYNVPVNEAYNLEAELLSFYNVSAKHVINALTSASTRIRLQQFTSSSALDSRSLLVDLYRLQEEHLTTVIARDAQCGLVRHLSSLVPGGVAAPDIDDYIITKETVRSRRLQQQSYFDVLSGYENLIEKPSYSSFTIAVLCNPDQAEGLRGEQSSFSWCDNVFETSEGSKKGAYKIDPLQKRLFTIMETLDFVWLSGLGGDDARTDSKFLMTTNVTTLGTDGSLLALPEIPECYKMNISIIKLGVTSIRGCLSADGYMVQALGRPFEPKLLARDYQKNFTAVNSTLSRDMSSTILLRSSEPGIFGVYGQDCPVNARKPVLALPNGGDTTFVYYAFGGVMASVALVVVTWVGTSFSSSGFGAALGIV
ncbi:unnamed protein product [Chondrus crispus]|uniref:PKD/REJ-like domain-containing protein n=1 Tax=Chondrus crispus TaxID=2769 RepID=R7QLQ0_CHOCR|nr:unnamed protein product [Chondrus crispus]CDF38325.1 unnamed protein product [Chondrus crispus]|eukprot:XP_005718210.1 unnamed protein product [Chondrus crispus]